MENLPSWMLVEYDCMEQVGDRNLRKGGGDESDILEGHRIIAKLSTDVIQCFVRKAMHDAEAINRRSWRVLSKIL